MLELVSFTCLTVDSDNPCLRRPVPFGNTGYVAWFEIEGEETTTILAIRHKHEDDYYYVRRVFQVTLAPQTQQVCNCSVPRGTRQRSCRPCTQGQGCKTAVFNQSALSANYY
jgi:hypothetical protein